MDKQITETVWQPYPKYKPEIGISYRVQIHHKDALPDFKMVFDDAVYVEYNGFLGWHTERWVDSINDTRLHALVNVIAFAKPPAPYDPEAKTVNFATACLWMREDKSLKMVCLKYPDVEVWFENKKGYMPRFVDAESGFITTHDFSYEEIMGEWERVG